MLFKIPSNATLMKKTTTKTSKIISSVLLSFVLLSGTFAMANIPSANAADERKENPIFSIAAVPTTSDVESAMMTASASSICDVVGLPVDTQQVATENFTSQSFPTDGDKYVILSTGNAAALVPNTAGYNASISTGGPDGLPFPPDVQDGFGNDANDVGQIAIDCMIPVGVTTLTFDWIFGSDEPPTFTPDAFSDYFRTNGTVIGNVLTLPISGDVVTANNIDQLGAELANNVTGSSTNPTAPLPSPDDTGLNAVLCTPTSTVACSQPQNASIDVSPYQGQTISFVLEVADDADAILDSAAYIDNFDTDATGDIIKVCDDGNICKTVIIDQETEDGVIVVNELINYTTTVIAMNNLGEDIDDAVVKDRFGGDLSIVDPAQGDVNEIGGIVGECDVNLKGKTKKAQVDCDAGTLSDGESAGFWAVVQTDINPGQGKKSEPKREYTSCGIHDVNSGATLSGVLADGTEVEFSTPSVSVEVFDYADLSGDCDGDGFTDGDEKNVYGTDPFDPNDQPTCDGINTVDVCVDGDGTATANAGTFQVIWGDPLTSWPTGFDNEGIDMFDTDGSCTWTAGDDLHVEGSAYPTALRNAIHDDYTAADGTVFLDPLILDLDLSLTNQTQVDIDLETGSTFTGCLGVDPLLKFHNANGMTNWDDGEDIILDVNGNGVFD